MRYVMSDVHGEYELFVALMRRIGFCERDELYICGDILEKGPSSVRLAELVLSLPNVHCIRGNHEEAFLAYYRSLMRDAGDDVDGVLASLRTYLAGDGERLTWDIVDRLEALPYYIETDDFICVHAGAPLRDDGTVAPLAEAAPETLLYDRTFKDPTVLPRDSKCVFFGHTPTTAIFAEPRMLAYKKPNATEAHIRSYAKVHLDTCSFVSGVLGCFCIDTCRVYYVRRP